MPMIRGILTSRAPLARELPKEGNDIQARWKNQRYLNILLTFDEHVWTSCSVHVSRAVGFGLRADSYSLQCTSCTKLIQDVVFFSSWAR